MPEHLFLVRHAQTTWDLEHRLHGRMDSPVTDEGVVQAQRMAARLAGRGIASVCSSPLGRSLRTAEIIAERIGADLVEVPDLAEVDHGEMAGLTRAEIDELFPTARQQRAENRYGWAFPRGESYAQARGRARRALSTCGWASRGIPVLVSHEMLGRMLRAELRGLDVSTALSLRHPHDVVFEIEHGAETIL